MCLTVWITCPVKRVQFSIFPTPSNSSQWIKRVNAGMAFEFKVQTNLHLQLMICVVNSVLASAGICTAAAYLCWKTCSMRKIRHPGVDMEHEERLSILRGSFIRSSASIKMHWHFILQAGSCRDAHPDFPPPSKPNYEHARRWYTLNIYAYELGIHVW